MSDIEPDSLSDSYEDILNQDYDSEVQLEQSMCSFSPPLWHQRIDAIRSFIIDNQIFEVVDLGCGEGKLLEDLIPVNGIKKLTGVDIDPNCLYKASEKARPSACDYVMRRKYLLTVRLLQGDLLASSSILSRHPQAVVLSEVIEHVLPEEVSLLTKNLFGYLNPEYAIVTTPNREFNVFFNLGDRLRIQDHKFEWTRGEFTKWCEDVCRDYNYDVEISGVGLNEGNNSYGFCTQIGKFSRRSLLDFPEVSENGYSESYSVSYPVHQKRSIEDRFHYYLLREMYSRAQTDEEEGWVLVSSLRESPRLSKLTTKSGKDLPDLLNTISEKHRHHIQLSPGRRNVRLTPQDYEDQSSDES